MESIYKISSIEEALCGNAYPGRGIIIGKSENGQYAAVAYFIMGRSENSRNRVFTENNEEGITIYPFDESKVEDPSLIIYSPIRKIGNSLIVTNGNQTDTVYDFVKEGKDFVSALNTREFEPDAPNFTPRISGILDFANDDFTYKMSILKSADEKGSACNRDYFFYSPLNGLGHLIHTYNTDGNPIPTFTGEPRRVAIGNDFEQFSESVWNSINETNKISLCTKFIDLKTGETVTKIYNKNK